MRFKTYFLSILFCAVAFFSKGAAIGPYGVLVNVPYNGVATDFLNGTGQFSAPAGGGGSSDNWSASGTTNSTLAGVASANGGIFTNGVSIPTSSSLLLNGDEAVYSSGANVGFNINGAAAWSFTATSLQPVASGTHDLGISSSTGFLDEAYLMGSYYLYNSSEIANYQRLRIYSSATNIFNLLPQAAGSANANISLNLQSLGTGTVQVNGVPISAGSSDNWTASGTTNSTLPGIGSADQLVGTNGLSGATLDTGQGANELYDMDQNVLTTSTPQYARMGIGAAAPGTSALGLPAGTAANPSLAWSADDDGTGTGFFRNAANQVSISANGVQSAIFDSATLYLPTTLGAIRMGAALDLWLTRESGTIFQLGFDAAAPIAHTIKGPDGVGTDKIGSDFTVAPGQSTGTGAPGRVRVKSSFSAGTGAGVNAYTTSVAVGGTLKVDTTTTGNVGANEDDLISYSVPANQVAVNGDYLEFDCWGTFAANANTARLKVFFGATAIMDTTSLLFNGVPWRAHGKIIRTGAATQEATCEITVGGTLLSAVNSTITSQSNPAETLSGAVTFKVTGEDTGGVPADNKVVQKAMVIRWHPNN